MASTFPERVRPPFPFLEASRTAVATAATASTATTAATATRFLFMIVPPCA